MIACWVIRLGINSARTGSRSGLLALMLLLTAGAVSQAQQFSAELTRNLDGVTAPAGRLRVFDDKVRIESPEFPDGFFLIDAAIPAAFFVRPAPRLFMDAKQSSPLVRLFVPVDPDNPCRQWQAMATVAGLTDQGELRCAPVGTETIDGHATAGYRATAANGSSFIGWIDRVRRIPLRVTMQDGATITAESIRDEPQDGAWFEIPKRSRKFDPLALIEQIKQSDVWVAAPKPAP